MSLNYSSAWFFGVNIQSFISNLCSPSKYHESPQRECYPKDHQKQPRWDCYLFSDRKIDCIPHNKRLKAQPPISCLSHGYSFYPHKPGKACQINAVAIQPQSIIRFFQIFHKQNLRCENSSKFLFKAAGQEWSGQRIPFPQSTIPPLKPIHLDAQCSKACVSLLLGVLCLQSASENKFQSQCPFCSNLKLHPPPLRYYSLQRGRLILLSRLFRDEEYLPMRLQTSIYWKAWTEKAYQIFSFYSFCSFTNKYNTTFIFSICDQRSFRQLIYQSCLQREFEIRQAECQVNGKTAVFVSTCQKEINLLQNSYFLNRLTLKLTFI